MCVLLEWLWGSTWARHRCAPTYTKTLTMTVSPKHIALRNQLLPETQTALSASHQQMAHQSAHQWEMVHTLYIYIYIICGCITLLLLQNNHIVLMNATTQNVIIITLNAEIMQLQHSSCASLCFVLEMKKKKILEQFVSFQRHKARCDKTWALNQMGSNMLAVLWLNTKMYTPPCDQSLARRNKTLSLKLRLVLIWNARQRSRPKHQIFHRVLWSVWT